MQQAILEAREQRWQAKLALARAYRACVLSLCLNIPGPDKNPPGAEQACALLQAALRKAHAREAQRLLASPAWTSPKQRKAQRAVLHTKSRRGSCAAFAREICGKGADGPYRLMVSPLPGRTLKRMAVSLESAHPLGRLADIDILTETGKSVSRTDLGLPPRSCFLCGEPAALCRRSKKHAQGELAAFIGALLRRALSL